MRQRLSLTTAILTFLLFALLSCAAYPTEESSPERLHLRGRELAYKGNIREAVANLRAACRAAAAIRSDPVAHQSEGIAAARNITLALFLNDLGVLEMRMGLLQKAWLRFHQAQWLDPYLNTATDNLRQLEQQFGGYTGGTNPLVAISGSYGYEELQNGKKLKYQSHRVLKIPEVSAANFYQSTLNGVFYSAPVIIRGVFSWVNKQAAADFLSDLVREHGKSVADYYPQNMFEKSVNPFFLSLADAVRQLSYPTEVFETVDASQPGTYVQWNLDSLSWSSVLHMLQKKSRSTEYKHILEQLDGGGWVNSCLPTDDEKSKFYLATHWKMLLIGEKSSGMFNHKDTLRTASWQLQLSGDKLWHLCSSANDKFLYDASAVDMFAPNYQNFPLAMYVNYICNCST